MTSSAKNIEVVEQFLSAFDRRWPTEDELAELVAPEVRVVERPNLFNPAGSERDAAAMRAALERGRQLLAWQSYEVRDHLAGGDTVVTRMRWRASLASTPDRGPPAHGWPRGASRTTAQRQVASSRSSSTTVMNSRRGRRSNRRNAEREAQWPWISVSPECSTARASSTREETPTLRKMLRRWVSTVF